MSSLFSTGCKFATLIFTHTDPLTYPKHLWDDPNLEVSWSAQFVTGKIDNGTISMGINPAGNLDVPTEQVSQEGYSVLGLRLDATNGDALAPGCPCEGWGIANVDTKLSGWANQYEGGTHNMTVESFTQSATSATSIVNAGSLNVRQDFVTGLTPNYYQIAVTITNHDALNAAHVVYRRVIDWDVDPTAFEDIVTLNQSAIPPWLKAWSDDGFQTADPLRTFTRLHHFGPFVNVGPDDVGAAFDIDLGSIPGNGTKTFYLVYGAAEDESHAQSAIVAAQSVVWSIAKPNLPGAGIPNTFFFGVRVP